VKPLYAPYIHSSPLVSATPMHSSVDEVPEVPSATLRTRSPAEAQDIWAGVWTIRQARYFALEGLPGDKRALHDLPANGADIPGRLCFLGGLIVMFVVFVAFALTCPWWRTFVLAMTGGDLIVAERHVAEGRRHVLYCEKCPGSTMGWRQEPRSFMEEI